jgi:hypothetical protein
MRKQNEMARSIKDGVRLFMHTYFMLATCSYIKIHAIKWIFRYTEDICELAYMHFCYLLRLTYMDQHLLFLFRQLDQVFFKIYCFRKFKS